ncbi:MAG: hypothetical protein EOO15_14050 [Chitinophagaceae bacterium]|nr:MAG: hypothetical protein EOO15_14050 [Chitinophagaceae bacterium]
MNPTKRILRLLYCVSLLFAGASADAQGTATNSSETPVRKGVTGIWRGYFITEAGEQYKLEFQIDAPTGTVRGISYSYLDQRFYGKSTMKGFFNASTSKFTIEETRTVEVRNIGGGGTCLMNYKLEFSQSGKELFLEGTYLGKREDRANPKNNGSWGDCGGGRVYLRRVETSDFYEEPFLKRRDSIARARLAPKPAPRRTTPPVARTTPKPPARRPATNPVTRTTPPKPKAQTPAPPVTKTPAQTDPPVTQPVVTPKRPEPVPVPVQTRNRENATAKVFDIRNEEILVKLYDNGEIDGDTISVYLDNKLVISHKGLSASPIELRVKLDPASPEHTLIMVAENMGRIPPNTSLMIVWDGDKRYEVQITSTEQKNAMVRFRYAGPAPAGTP